MHTDLPLDGRVALVTGVSRRRGIGFAVARRLAEMGASLALHHHLAHDLAEYGGIDDIETLIEDLREDGPGRMVALPGDLSDPSASEDLVVKAHDLLGHLDILICSPASSSPAVAPRSRCLSTRPRSRMCRPHRA